LGDQAHRGGGAAANNDLTGKSLAGGQDEQQGGNPVDAQLMSGAPGASIKRDAAASSAHGAMPAQK